MKSGGQVRYRGKIWHAGKSDEWLLQTDETGCSFKMCFSDSCLWMSEPKANIPIPPTHSHNTHVLTEEFCSQMMFVSAAAKPDERERWSFLMLQLGPHCLGKHTTMNISVWRSPRAPTVGAWHTYRHRNTRTHRHLHTQIQSLQWLPELFTSQSQMPQLSHQYHCINDANGFAHWTKGFTVSG